MKDFLTGNIICLTELPQLLIVVITLAIITGLYIVGTYFFAKSRNNLKWCVLVEETIVIVSVSYLLASVFYPHISLTLWIGFYFLYTKYEKRNRVIKYYTRFWNRKYNADAFAKKLKIANMTSLIYELVIYKKELSDNTDMCMISKEQWDSTKITLHHYLIGLVMFSISMLQFGNPYNASEAFLLACLGNVIGTIGIMYMFYLPFYFYSIHEKGDSDATDFCFVMSCLIAAYIVFWWTTHMK